MIEKTSHLMNSFFVSFYTYIKSLPSPDRTKDRLSCIFHRIFFYARTFVDASQSQEYLLFKELKAFSTLPESKFSPDKEASFSSLVEKIHHLFNDSLICSHLFRLTNQTSLEQYKKEDNSSWANYQKSQGEEKRCIRLHELTEILFLKWDLGVGFEKHDFRHFFPAHQNAIKIENLYLLSLARKLDLPLSLNALEYFRAPDEFALSNCLHIDGESLNGRDLNCEIQNAVEILTRKKEKKPSLIEMEQYILFMTKSSAHKRIDKKSLKDWVWSRFFFTTLYEQYKETHVKVIFLLLYFMQKQVHFDKYPPQKLLQHVTQVLRDLTPEELQHIDNEFINNMHSLAHERPLYHFFSKIVEKYTHSIDPVI